MQPPDGVGGASALPLAWRQASKGEEAVAGFLQTIGDGAVLESPFADEGLAGGPRSPHVSRRVLYPCSSRRLSTLAGGCAEAHSGIAPLAFGPRWKSIRYGEPDSIALKQRIIYSVTAG